MLMNVLAVAVGVVTVILMLSLVVTTIVEALVMGFAVRKRFLLLALSQLVATAQKLATSPKAAEVAGDVEAAAAAGDVEPIAPRTPVRLTLGRFQPKSAPVSIKQSVVFEKLSAAMRENEYLMPRTRLSREELPLLLRAFGPPLPDAVIKAADDLFPLMEQRSKESFKKAVTMLNFAAALFVAFLSGVDTSALVGTLYRDPELRGQLVAIGREISERGIESKDGEESSQEQATSGQAKSKPSTSEPADTGGAAPSATAAPASGAAASATTVATESASTHAAATAAGVGASPTPRAPAPGASRAAPQPASTVEAPEGSGALASTARADAPMRGEEAWDKLRTLLPALLDDASTDHPFRYRMEHALGILLTAFLLSLGGPFWFDILHRLIGLLGPPQPDPPSPSPQPSAQRTRPAAEVVE